jgi:hypothetical protein
MARPHKIEVHEMLTFFVNHEVEGASATTADGTQRKTLLRKGGVYLVRRRYLVAGEKDQVVYQGENLEEAVRSYNGLS